MENKYLIAKEICLDAIKEFYENINDLLSDMDGSYMIDWTMSDVLYVQRHVNATIETILSTELRHHVTFELNIVQQYLKREMKANNIEGVKDVLQEAMTQFSYVYKACKRIK